MSESPSATIRTGRSAAVAVHGRHRSERKGRERAAAALDQTPPASHMSGRPRIECAAQGQAQDESLHERQPRIATPAIALSGVNLSLGRGAARVHILKDIDLNIGRGEAVGLVGPSGSGKSTLLMVMAGLERPTPARSSSPGEDLGALDEDALARFRGRNVGIVFQSFHLIPTMTALENVAVPLELAGRRGRLRSRRAPSLPRSALRERVNHYPARAVGRRAAARRARARARAAIPRSWSPTSRPAISTRRPAREIIELLFAGHETRSTTLVLVTHDAALAQRCDRVVRLRSGRIEAEHAHRQREPVAQRDRSPAALRACARCAAACAASAVFISCIALGVAAIAGVGSFARSLADGLAREGRIILGGDASFSLMAREASARRAHVPR